MLNQSNQSFPQVDLRLLSKPSSAEPEPVVEVFIKEFHTIDVERAHRLRLEVTRRRESRVERRGRSSRRERAA